MTIEHLQAERFDELSQAALANASLRKAVANATGLISERRAAAVGSFEGWQELRERARRIKAETLARLDHYLVELTDKAQARGVQVHWARDASEARTIVRELAERLGATTIAKSKSMTTEEIGLNHALEAAGLEPIETDLGEWIIQLAGETPSHIIAPGDPQDRARRSDELFTEKLSVARTDDPAELTDIARELLREEFAKAGLGISGVNFAIAETGSFHVLENEGNARMSTSLPRAHLAVMGIEKVIPEARRPRGLPAAAYRAPGRASTSRATSRSSRASRGTRRGKRAPTRCTSCSSTTGAASMLADDVRRQSLACIRCGACLNTCPVYKSDRRPRLRFGVPGSDRSDHHAATRGR